MRKPDFQQKATTKDICQTMNSIQLYGLDEYGWHAQTRSISLEGQKVHPPLLANNTSKVMEKRVCFLIREDHQVMDSISKRLLYVLQHLSIVFKICQKQQIQPHPRGSHSPASKCIYVFQLVLCIFCIAYAWRLTLWSLHAMGPWGHLGVSVINSAHAWRLAVCSAQLLEWTLRNFSGRSGPRQVSGTLKRPLWTLGVKNLGRTFCPMPTSTQFPGMIRGLTWARGCSGGKFG